MKLPVPLLKFLFPSLVWRIASNDKVLYLTFDDGPVPDVTPYVLDTLRLFNAKATFFCIGNNVRENPEIYNRILNEGHSVGNHTYNHFNAFKVSSGLYMEDVKKAAEKINSSLFRPPYGKITPRLIKKISPGYRIVMWDVLSHDYDVAKTTASCFNTVKKNAQRGSVIVFHDSIKAFPRMRNSLVMTLEYFSSRGYKFLPIRQE